MANIALGLEDCLYLGNINSLRDWGHARDYVEMQWLMLQQEKPIDFVIATGRQISVKDFVYHSFRTLGVELEFKGSGVDEIAVVASIDTMDELSFKVGDTVLRVDSKYYRPTEVDTLLGDPSFAQEKLGWTPKVTAEELCREMTLSDLRLAKREKFITEAGYSIPKSATI